MAEIMAKPTDLRGRDDLCKILRKQLLLLYDCGYGEVKEGDDSIHGVFERINNVLCEACPYDKCQLTDDLKSKVPIPPAPHKIMTETVEYECSNPHCRLRRKLKFINGNLEQTFCGKRPEMEEYIEETTQIYHRCYLRSELLEKKEHLCKIVGG